MTSEFSIHTRKKAIDSMDGNMYDVVVIGGGITGSGIANILAENGVNTLLLEKNDFASGTSSGSSKLVHGGLRYLQNGRLLEVFRLLKERNYLMNHTDIVTSLEFHIFTGKDMWNSSELGLGLSLYNVLSGKLAPARHIRNDGRYPETIDGYYSYFDGITIDSVLVIYNIVSAQNHGATCLNYVEAVSIKMDGENYAVSIHDNISGSNKTIISRIIINAAGPWGDRISHMAGIDPEESFRLSKGIHLVFPFSLWGRKNAAVIRSSIDGRQLFIIPSGEIVYIGTTDKFTENPDDFSISNEDTKYLLDSLKPLFPEFEEDKIITSFAGIRVLFGSGDNPGEISRDFKITRKGNFIFALGGKLTDYRVGSRKVAKIVSSLLGRKLKIKNMPFIDYSRSAGNLDQIIKYECPVKPEDIMRRRLALRIYSGDSGKFMEQKACKLMEDEYENTYPGK
ncbi:FAD-dependent oxidoreductase [Ferroplasma sp.]|uniref:FAD-dependent oxidoreductase n=1 Tax=Ferroplasma sp. TaxID=2591003 RepID=UPI00307ED631